MRDAPDGVRQHMDCHCQVLCSAVRRRRRRVAPTEPSTTEAGQAASAEQLQGWGHIGAYSRRQEGQEPVQQEPLMPSEPSEPDQGGGETEGGANAEQTQGGHAEHSQRGRQAVDSEWETVTVASAATDGVEPTRGGGHPLPCGEPATDVNGWGVELLSSCSCWWHEDTPERLRLQVCDVL